MTIPLSRKRRLRLRKVWFWEVATCMKTDKNFTIPAQQRNKDREIIIPHFPNPPIYKG